MRRFSGSRSRRLGLLSGILVLGVAGVGYATIPDAGRVYTACMLKNVGTVRLIDPSLPAKNLMSHCSTLESPITWDQQGARGTPGAPGLKGDPGLTGPPGPPGAGDEVLHQSVNSDGTMVPGGDATSVTYKNVGEYSVVFAQDLTGCSAVATVGDSIDFFYPAGAPNVATADVILGIVRVITVSPLAATNVDASFHLIVAC
jgi:hypothetical protein